MKTMSFKRWCCQTLPGQSIWGRKPRKSDEFAHEKSAIDYTKVYRNRNARVGVYLKDG